MPYKRGGVVWGSELEWAVNDRLIHAGRMGQAREAMSMLGGVFVIPVVCSYDDKLAYAAHVWGGVQRVIPEAQLVGVDETQVMFSVPPDPAKWSSPQDQRGVPYDSKDAPYVTADEVLLRRATSVHGPVHPAALPSPNGKPG